VSSNSIRIPHLALRITALLMGAVSLAIVVATWQFFVNSEQGQHIDEIAFDGSLTLKAKLWWLAAPILDVVSFLYVGVSIVVVVGIALIRKRWMLAVQAATIIVGANVMTQVLKKLVFDRPDFSVVWAPGNSLPSGHTTAAASVSHGPQSPESDTPQQLECPHSLDNGTECQMLLPLFSLLELGRSPCARFLLGRLKTVNDLGFPRAHYAVG
jgi:hypothetical protein